MLTIFSIPKAFKGHIGLIQRNALRSWKMLHPSIQIILFGNDEGVAEAAFEFGAEHRSELRVNAFGTPLVSDAFHKARDIGRWPVLMYTNADMLYNGKIMKAVGRLNGYERYILSGERFDCEIVEDLVAAPIERWLQVFEEHRRKGLMSGASAMDYFIFPRTFDLGMPEFAVGRVGWDSWVVWRCRQMSVPFVDATKDVEAFHQNHSYASLALGCQHRHGPERELNIREAGGLRHLLTLREASHQLVGGVLRKPAGWRVFTSWLATRRPYLFLLAFKRWLGV